MKNSLFILLFFVSAFSLKAQNMVIYDFDSIAQNTMLNHDCKLDINHDGIYDYNFTPRMDVDHLTGQVLTFYSIEGTISANNILSNPSFDPYYYISNSFDFLDCYDTVKFSQLNFKYTVLKHFKPSNYNVDYKFIGLKFRIDSLYYTGAIQLGIVNYSWLHFYRLIYNPNPGEDLILDPLILGVSQIEKEKSLSVYPNPTSGIINIPKNFKEFQLFDSQGKQIQGYRLNNQQLDLSNLNKGLYFLYLISNDKVEIIQKISLQD